MDKTSWRMPVANLNKVMLIGRLTRDPEPPRVFANGGKVINFGFAVNNRRKNQQSGEWEDDPCYLDCKAFNREQGRKMADLVEQHFRKGKQFYVEGHLVFEQWEAKDGGGKRSKIVVVLDDFQFLEPRTDGAGGGTYESRAPRSAPASRPAATASRQDAYDEPQPDHEPSGPGGDSDIPF